MSEGTVKETTRQLDQASMTRFAGQLGHRYPHMKHSVRNHHTDPEIARSLGLPGTVAQALHYCAFLSQLMLEEDGEAWLTSGEFEMTFLLPVLADDQVRVSLETTGASGSHRVECRNQHGELVAIGTAHVGE
jgi:acyl dehydratase